MSKVYDVEVELSSRYTVTIEADCEEEALRFAEEWEPGDWHPQVDFEQLEEVTFRQVKAETLKRVSEPSKLEQAAEELAGLELRHTPAGSFLSEEDVRGVLEKYFDDEE